MTANSEPTQSAGQGAGEEGGQRRLAEQYAVIFYALFKTLRMYDVNNAAIQKPLAAFSKLIQYFIKHGPLNLLHVEESYYLNAQKLRLKEDERDRLAWLFRELNKCNVGAVAINRAIAAEELARAMKQFAEITAHGTDFAQVQQQLQSKAGDLIALTHQQFVKLEETCHEDELDARTAAYLSYARLLVLTRAFMASLNRPSRLQPLSRQLRRSMQDIVNVCLRGSEAVLGLASVKHYEAYLPNHAVNTAVLAVALANRIGLSKGAICEVGLAALFADTGTVVLINEQLKERQPQDQARQEVLHQHPTASVGCIMRGRSLSAGTLRHVMVAFEHHRGFDGSGFPEIGRTAGPDLYARIVAVADGFDSLTTSRAGHEAYLPDEALQIMMRESGTKYDPALLKIFVNLVGLYPLGTAVRLSSGEIGIVYLNHSDPRYARWPRIYLVRDATEQAVDGPLLDLSTPEAGGRQIAKTVDPAKFGINVAHYLMTR